jgi:hypothetical protein
VLAHAPLTVSLHAELPSVTPVCFASMFTGARPAEHGITRYERPVLRCETLFDALIAAGRRVAIIAVKGSSIDLIFRERTIDYFSEPYDPEVIARACEIVAEDRHDFVLAYVQEYDDVMHETTPTAEEAIAAMERNLDGFVTLARCSAEHWSEHARVIAFTPDHGAHVSSESGKGTHGDDRPEDLEVQHYFGFAAADDQD